VGNAPHEPGGVVLHRERLANTSHFWEQSLTAERAAKRQAHCEGQVRPEGVEVAGNGPRQGLQNRNPEGGTPGKYRRENAVDSVVPIRDIFPQRLAQFLQ
jgi:hypothetical protein